MINIVTSLNSSYQKFGKIFLNSLYKNLSLENIKNVFILDVGLSEEDKEWLSEYDKLTIVDTNVDTEFDGIWGKGWELSVASKTIGFRKLLLENNYPLVMVDSDCLFLKDFEDLLDDSYDLQICNRNYGTPYLASFFVAHNEKAVEFVEAWITQINELKVMPKETTAMCMTIEKYKDKLNIGALDESLISSLAHHDDARIIHMKSSALDDNFNTTFIRRINGVKDLSANIILKYLEKD